MPPELIRSSILDGQKALVIGVANDRSIAWGCAQAMHGAGAEIAMTYLNERARPYVEPLAAAVEAPLFVPLEVRDDGRGFDSDDPPVSGRRHFGLQFMRERAELIGARFEVRSSPNLGTAVRMTIPPGAMGMPIPGEES